MDSIRDIKEAVEFPVLNGLVAMMRRRIHVMAQDTEGKRIGMATPRKGAYSKPWAKVREKANLKTDKINLDFYSDLRQALKVATFEGHYVAAIVGGIHIKKSHGHEDRYKTKIYSLSDSEKKFTRDTARELLRRHAINSVKKAFK